MKIAFVGKGGSGKTTMSGLLSRYLASKGHLVVAIDADINQHLATTLGLSEKEASSIPPMGIEIAKIKKYLRGTNHRIEDNSLMIKTTPPGEGSRLVKIAEKNEIFDYFSRIIHGVRLMSVGPFTEEDLGIRCYHSKTGAVELLLNHLIETEREYVIVDMTAGSDSFASGLFTRFDVTFLVVEPTTKSVSVYEQYKKYAKDFDVTIKVIGNKVQDADDLAFLSKECGSDLICTLKASLFVKRSDRGESVGMDELEEENKQSLEQIVRTIDLQKKDWEKFYRQAVFFHIKNAESWANSAMGKDLRLQVDPNFILKL